MIMFFMKMNYPIAEIYKRRYTNKPQYEFLRERIENISIIESQDHYSAMLLSNKVFNMSGSSIAWETFFTTGTSYSINFKNKPYYKNVKYLPENISFPDDVFNIDMESYTEIFQNNSQVEKEISFRLLYKK